MIRIDEPTRGRFGNKVFHYNTLMQLSSLAGMQASCVPWEGSQYFEGLCDFKPPTAPEPIQEITCNDLINLSHEELILRLKEASDIRVHGYALHGPYFRISNQDPRQFLRLKKEYIPDFDSRFTFVGIHIRGGDTRGGDGKNCREIHPFKFYKDAIDFVLSVPDLNPVFFICTDDPDPSFESYAKTLDYLATMGRLISLQTSHHWQNYIQDFAALCYADILISGSSTFVLAAGILGKKKKIIHSNDFFAQFLHGEGSWYSGWGNQSFFKDAIQRPSKFYNLWRLV